MPETATNEVISDEQQSGLDRIVIVIPVYNDWEAISLLLLQIDKILPYSQFEFHIVLVDDGSTVECNSKSWNNKVKAINSARVLRLRRNLGHQRAIAVGLTYVYKNMACRAVVVMDGDGEDKPSDIPVLLKELERLHGEKVIFAERKKRSESVLFRFCYFAYRIVHKVFTGIEVRVGNFSIIPQGYLSSLVVSSELWNHYAATVFRLRLPRSSVPTERGERLRGKGKMNFVSLVVHGLSAISVFGEVASIRVLLGAGLCILFSIFLIGIIIAIRFWTDLAIPGWATYASGLLIILLFQVVTISNATVLNILSKRDSFGFLPIRDCGFFIEGVRALWGCHYMQKELS